MISIEHINHHFLRMVYWTRLKLSKKYKSTTIYVCVPNEYLEDNYKGTKQEQINSWSKEVLEKWTNLQLTLEDDFYDIPNHYDAYANTREGEANCIDFMMKLANS